MNLSLNVGGSFEEYVQWLSPDGSVQSLADWSAQLDVRSAPGEPLILRLSTTDGTILHEGTDLKLFLPKDATLDLVPGTYSYDLLITLGDRRPMLLSGSFGVRQPITVPV